MTPAPVDQQGVAPDESPMVAAAVVEPPMGALESSEVDDSRGDHGETIAARGVATPGASTLVEGGDVVEGGEAANTPSVAVSARSPRPDDDGNSTIAQGSSSSVASGPSIDVDRCPTDEHEPLALTGRVPETIDDLDDASATGPARARGKTSRVRLDPSEALDVPTRPPPPRRRRALPPRFTAVVGGLFGLAGIASLLALVIQLDGTPRGFGPAGRASGAPSARAAPGARAPGLSALAHAAPNGPSTSASVAIDKASTPPTEPRADEPKPDEAGPFRVAQMASDEGVRVITGKLGTRSLTDALEEEHVPRAQVFRVLKAFDDAKVFDKPRKSHAFVVAVDRASKRVKAFEYQASATDVWQAREGEDGRLAGQKLDLKVEQRRIARAVVVSGDLKASVVEAGFDDDLVDALDAALGDRISLSRLARGSSLRVVVQEQTVSGKFARYLSIDAVEYTTPKSDKPTRVFHYRAGKNSGYFDDNGKAPYQGGWRAPLKLPRVTSRFNPKRLHPVLHTVMPHNGVDFGAATGTPVYAVSHGTVSAVGPHGPSGNLVLIEHDGGIQTGYAHLSRFAPGLKAGDKVETRQLVGFVGSTGRSTGPHLHFSVKKNGQFVDPLTALKMDGERVLPRSEREAFDAFRAEMNRLLDGIALPDRPGTPPSGGEDRDDDGDSDNHGNHGEEDDGAPASPSASAAPAPEERPAAPVTPPPTRGDDSAVDSAVWKPF